MLLGKWGVQVLWIFKDYFSSQRSVSFYCTLHYSRKSKIQKLFSTTLIWPSGWEEGESVLLNLANWLTGWQSLQICWKCFQTKLCCLEDAFQCHREPEQHCSDVGICGIFTDPLFADPHFKFPAKGDKCREEMYKDIIKINRIVSTEVFERRHGKLWLTCLIVLSVSVRTNKRPTNRLLFHPKIRKKHIYTVYTQYTNLKRVICLYYGVLWSDLLITHSQSA